MGHEDCLSNNNNKKQKTKMESLLSILYLEMKSHVSQAGHELLILLPTSPEI